uniref:Uncharacterized protein n=1 Tax=Pristhesancus plagipennis TaxID=1955184 RepID=A0A2K8JMT7_PRIPG|nr:secreted hypothetical protein [Pristhesancus plagipennis]
MLVLLIWIFTVGTSCLRVNNLQLVLSGFRFNFQLLYQSAKSLIVRC